MPKRIFIVASWYPSSDQPARGIFIEEQAVALSERYDVVVIAPELRRWRDRLAGGSGVRVERRRGVQVVRVDRAPSIPRFARWRSSAYLGAVRSAYEVATARFGTPGIIHAHVVLPGGWAAARLADEQRIPLVLTEHSNPFSMHLRTDVDRRNVAWTLRQASAVVAVSPSLRKDITDFAPGIDVAVLGNVIDTEFFAPGPHPASADPGEHPLRVLSVGLLTASKNMDRVIDAVAALAGQDHRGVDLAIVGDGPERGPLEEQAGRLGIADRTRFLGVLDRTGVRDEMRRSDVLVLASDAETFGVVLAEAMACARPVIATHSGGSDYVIEPGLGVLVPVGDTVAIAGALRGVADGSLAVDAEAARLSIVRRFGPQAFLESIGRLYGGVISGEAGSA